MNANLKLSITYYYVNSELTLESFLFLLCFLVKLLELLFFSDSLLDILPVKIQQKKHFIE